PNQVATVHSRSDQVSLALAEAGLNMAISRLQKASDPSMQNALPATPLQPETAMEGGTATYFGILDLAQKVWTLTGIGRVASPQNSIGSSDDPVHDVHIAGGCSTDGVHYDKPCGVADRVWGTVVDTTPTDLTKPPVDMLGTYNSAGPGPKHACSLGSVPWGSF